MFEWMKKRRHARILETPLPPAWREIVERNVPAFARLEDDEKRTLLEKTQIFLAEKRFEGCGGLELTDEMRVTIAATACLLLVHLDEEDVFPTVTSILVYPSAYKVPPQKRRLGGVIVEGDEAHAGESWGWGTLVLAWDHVQRRAHGAETEGKNLVVHEFAHALDWEDGAGDGAPVLPRRAMYGPWAEVLGAEFARLAAERDDGVLDAYGATNPAEFFAVASEAFFERPERLARDHRALYDQLAAFYRQDPARRS